MACKKCNDCQDNGCAPTVYPKCILMDKAYPCLGVSVGKTGSDLFAAIESFVCSFTPSTPVTCPSWSNLTLINGVTSVIQPQILKDFCGNISIRGTISQALVLTTTSTEIVTYPGFNIASGGGIFTSLSVGFRPSLAVQTFPVYAQVNLASSTIYNTITYVRVLSTGEMFIDSLRIDTSLFPSGETITITVDLSTVRFSVL